MKHALLLGLATLVSLALPLPAPAQPQLAPIPAPPPPLTPSVQYPSAGPASDRSQLVQPQYRESLLSAGEAAPYSSVQRRQSLFQPSQYQPQLAQPQPAPPQQYQQDQYQQQQQYQPSQYPQQQYPQQQYPQQQYPQQYQRQQYQQPQGQQPQNQYPVLPLLPPPQSQRTAPPPAAAAPPTASPTASQGENRDQGQPPVAPEQPAPPPPNPWLPQGGAVLQALDKVNAQTTVLTVKVGQTATYGSLRIAVQACVVRPPDMPQDAAAQLTITDSHPDQPGFKGWMLKSNPSLAMLEHPLYDIRVSGCAP